MNRRNVRGVILALLGIVLFSSKAVMVKMAYLYDVDALSLLLFRMLFALPFYLLIIILYKRQSQTELKRSDYLWLVLFGFLGYYVSSYLDFVGLQYLKASLERIILFIYPTLILIISRVFLKIKVKRSQVIAILITYFGIVITFYEEMQIADVSALWFGALCVFCASITYATYLVGSGWLIPKFGSVKFTAYAMVVACSSVIAHYGIYNETSITSFVPQVYWLGFAMAIFATVLPSFLVSEAIKLIGASNFGIIASVGPISTIILANIFLGETMTSMQILGTIVVIFGVITLAKKKPKQEIEVQTEVEV